MRFETMATVINRNDVPSHLFSIPELDFSDDLFSEPLSGPWFRLGAWTIKSSRDDRGVENVVERQSFLLSPQSFGEIFSGLECVGNVIHNLGRPHGSIIDSGEHATYRYTPFHRFEFAFTSVVAEPLVFHSTTSATNLFINPDLWLFFELEEMTPLVSGRNDPCSVDIGYCSTIGAA